MDMGTPAEPIGIPVQEDNRRIKTTHSCAWKFCFNVKITFPSAMKKPMAEIIRHEKQNNVQADRLYKSEMLR